MTYLIFLLHIVFQLCALLKDFIKIASLFLAAMSINPLMLTTAKTVRQCWWNLARKNINWKTFEGEMLIRTLPTTLLQIFCKIILNFKVIVKIIRNRWWFLEELSCIDGLMCPLMLTVAKTAWQFWWYLAYTISVRNIFEGEMLIRT